MEYIEGKCPKCSGELKVPETLDNIICMYCGEKISRDELVFQLEEKESQYRDLETVIWSLWERNDSIAVDKAKELIALEKQNYIANYVYAMGKMHTIVLDNMRLVDCFKKNLYPSVIDDYKKSTSDILASLETICLLRETESETIIDEATSKFIKGIQDSLEANPKLKSKSEIKTEIENIKYIITLFTVPMIQEQALSISKPLVETIHSKWNETYPKSFFKIGTFEEINNGFKRKGFCYITTAVCETLNKDDDCYELIMFRQFRDQYLRKEEEGEGLVQEYYQMAPKIVEKINQNEGKSAVYTEIWDKYLSSCLNRIEQGDNAGCKELYVEMMYDLNSKWAQ